FQAEDGIRDFHVTGVQTCALPIWAVIVIDMVRGVQSIENSLNGIGTEIQTKQKTHREKGRILSVDQAVERFGNQVIGICRHEHRSEERRVGKECGAQVSTDWETRK